MTKSELNKLGEEFCDALTRAFKGFDYISVGRDGIDPYNSPMYGCIVSVKSKDLTDEEFHGIENTIDSVCNDWKEKTDYGWNDSGFFWVAIHIDEIAPDPVNEDECPVCGAELEDNGEGVMYCPFCNPMEDDGNMEDGDGDGENDEDVESCVECGEDLIEDEDGEMVCPSCGWTEDYDGDGERCPECDKLVIEEDGVKKCPHCGWIDEEEYETIGEYCPKCGEELVNKHGMKQCLGCDWNEEDGYDDIEYCPECGEQVKETEQGLLYCPECDWTSDGGDHERCPECGAPTLWEMNDIKCCFECDWDERDDWDDDQWAEYYANR